MAIIRSGVLGNTRGKVAGVVGSQWKDKNYLREYVKPANPNTALQAAQRSKMADCVEFCKPLVGAVFNAFTDKFRKSMSGFNYFIKQNIAEFDGTPVYANVSVTDGKLSSIANVACTYDTADGDIVLTWDAAYGNNGSTDDGVQYVIYDTDSGFWYFLQNEPTRTLETLSETITSGLTATDLELYAWAVAYDGLIVTMISDSVHCQCTAA